MSADAFSFGFKLVQQFFTARKTYKSALVNLLVAPTFTCLLAILFSMHPLFLQLY